MKGLKKQMARKNLVSFDKVNKNLDGLFTLVNKGIDFGEVTSKTTENHDEMNALIGRLNSLINTIEEQEKSSINNAIHDVISPLIEQANGDISVLKSFVDTFISDKKTHEKTVETNVQNDEISNENKV